MGWIGLTSTARGKIHSNLHGDSTAQLNMLWLQCTHLLRGCRQLKISFAQNVPHRTYAWHSVITSLQVKNTPGLCSRPSGCTRKLAPSHARPATAGSSPYNDPAGPHAYTPSPWSRLTDPSMLQCRMRLNHRGRCSGRLLLIRSPPHSPALSPALPFITCARACQALVATGRTGPRDRAP